MNYVLNTDETIQKFVSSQKNESVPYLYLIDISTDRKGPVYTLTENIDYPYQSEDVEILMNTSYSSIDAPWEDCTILQSSFHMDTIERRMNIYPLIKQLIAFNTYRTANLWIDNQIFIGDIQIKIGNLITSFDEYTSDKEIEKTFRKLHMQTCVDHYLDNETVLIIKHNKYQFISIHDIPKKFDKIGIPLKNTETLYLLSYKEYKLFQNIQDLEFLIMYPEYDSNDCIDFDWDCTAFNSGISRSSTNSIEIISLKDFLESCLFLPQMILMEKNIYPTPVEIYLCIHTKSNRVIELTINDEESDEGRNVCFFKIIKKLLKM